MSKEEFDLLVLLILSPLPSFFLLLSDGGGVPPLESESDPDMFPSLAMGVAGTSNSSS